MIVLPSCLKSQMQTTVQWFFGHRYSLNDNHCAWVNRLLNICDKEGFVDMYTLKEVKLSHP